MIVGLQGKNIAHSPLPVLAPPKFNGAFLERQTYYQNQVSSFDHHHPLSVPQVFVGVVPAVKTLNISSSQPFWLSFRDTRGRRQQWPIAAHASFAVADDNHKVVAVKILQRTIPSNLRAQVFYLTPATAAPLAIADVAYATGFHWAGRQTRSYHGDLAILVGGVKQLTIVNVVDLETLLAGVVPAEMFATAPLEALKAQAVAARSLLMAQLGHRHQHEPYHFCAEQHCQVYAGATLEHWRSNQAVQMTRGQLLIWQNQPVPAVYSANCGGFGENNDAVWGQPPHPALRARSDFASLWQSLWPKWPSFSLAKWQQLLPHSYCAQGGKHKSLWHLQFSAQKLSNLIHQRYPQLGPVQALKPLKYSTGGRIVVLDVTGKKQRVQVHRELAIRQLLGNLQSSAFTIRHQWHRDGSLATVELHGRGWGHGVGLCQQGAMGRAHHGFHYLDILRHYYNQAKIQKMW